ncbi:general stress protein YciG [Pseudarthrobacter oxydans]|uniref:General stress protein YciG n=1 Tax=Pseudarthrobacter oxydans TaxID=1671 RepID=A0AAW8NEY3_PSEOX|nr:general stress protein YciG [Pseudarthrobacter oxydans]MDR7165416.1 general stress protein YciG [Pseudarthrobacter oxydans]
MPGTRAGGLKARDKNLANDPGFYARIGAKGGRNGRTGGFAANPELARVAGAKGGRISKRKKAAEAVES